MTRRPRAAHADPTTASDDCATFSPDGIGLFVVEGTAWSAAGEMAIRSVGIVGFPEFPDPAAADE